MSVTSNFTILPRWHEELTRCIQICHSFQGNYINYNCHQNVIQYFNMHAPMMPTVFSEMAGIFCHIQSITYQYTVRVLILAQLNFSGNRWKLRISTHWHNHELVSCKCGHFRVGLIFAFSVLLSSSRKFPHVEKWNSISLYEGNRSSIVKITPT